MNTTCKLNFSCITILISILFSCSSHESAYNEANAPESAPSDSFASSMADTLINVLPDVSKRKFIRTAEVKFKATDVSRTTETIEDITSRYNGFVTQSNLTSSIVNTHTTQLTADTLVEQTEYVVKNNMVIRIPNTHLDSLLRRISQLADFVDYRNISANDVSLNLLENTLKINRANEAEKRYTQAIDSKGKKLNESLKAEENRLAIQQEADNRTISNMSYMDQVNYSTVKLDFYQRSSIRTEKVYSNPAIIVYEPNLLAPLKDAFFTGWTIFEEILIFTVRIWALLVLGIVAIWAYKRYAVRALGKS